MSKIIFKEVKEAREAATVREAADTLDAQAALLSEAEEVLTRLLNPPAPFSASAIEEQGAVKGHARNLLSRIEASHD